MELLSAITRGTLEDFTRAVEEHPERDWKNFLFSAFKNKDLVARLEIAHWMLNLPR